MVNKNEFIELEYTGYLEDGTLFDTTMPAVAKEHDIERNDIKPIIISAGDGQVVPGLDKAVLENEIGKFKVTITPEEGFGKKKSELLKLIPTSKFKKENIQPHPGLEVEVDGERGTVKTVSGGRTIVDFNHPLSGHKITYECEIKRIVTDEAEKVKGLLNMIGIPVKEVTVEGEKAIIDMPQLPEQLTKGLVDEINRLTKIKTVEFKAEGLNKSEGEKQQ